MIDAIIAYLTKSPLVLIVKICVSVIASFFAVKKIYDRRSLNTDIELKNEQEKLNDYEISTRKTKSNNAFYQKLRNSLAEAQEKLDTSLPETALKSYNKELKLCTKKNAVHNLEQWYDNQRPSLIKMAKEFASYYEFASKTVTENSIAKQDSDVSNQQSITAQAEKWREIIALLEQNPLQQQVGKHV